MTQPKCYTTQLQAGLGQLHETKSLLNMWRPGMDSPGLYRVALESGRFPGLTARRLRNVVVECFAPRYLVEEGRPALILHNLLKALVQPELDQLLFLFTCRANAILADFIRQVYWPRYGAGQERMTNGEAREFVDRANREGRTVKPWADSTLRRVSGYLTGCCADFGLLSPGRQQVRKIIPFRIHPRAAVVIAYELHFAGLGDNSVVSHEDWGLFGLERTDVVDLLKRLSLNGHFIVQTAGDVTRLAWKHKNVEELADALAQG